MDIMESIPFDSLPVFFRIVLYFCGGCMSLVLVGLCIIAVFLTFTGIWSLFDPFFNKPKGTKKDE